MLKFVKHYMSSIDGVEIFPLFSFIVFFLFFIALGYFVHKLSKNHVAQMAELPLDNAPNPFHNEID